MHKILSILYIDTNLNIHEERGAHREKLHDIYLNEI